MSNFLAILEFGVFYIEYKNVKFTGINFRGRTNVKYLMETQILRFCKNTAKVSFLPLLKVTTKSTHFLPCEEEDTNTVNETSNKENTEGLKTLHLNTER